MSFATITGDRGLDRKLSELRSGARPMVRAALNRAALPIKRDLKKRVPGRLKNIRASIGHSVKQKDGEMNLKAGFGVGRSTAKPKTRSTDDGVGIDRKNVHWWVLGTDERFHKSIVDPKSGGFTSTGVMPDAGRGLLEQSVKATERQQAAEIEASVRKSIDKLRRKGGRK